MRLTIGIPTYDRLDYLREAVSSACGQTLEDIEILVSDDGESTELRSWCIAQTEKDRRLRYVRTPRRLRLAGNWNFIASLARGEYVTLMGDDDRLLPSFAERLTSEAKARDVAGIGVVFANHFIIDASGKRLVSESQAATRRFGRASLRGGEVLEPQDVVWGNGVPMMASIVRTEDVRRLGFKDDINTPELELFVRMAAEGATFVFVEDYLAEYRTHLASETSRGLTIDRLAEYLEAVEVSKAVEPAKRSCLRSMLVAGVGIRLGQGDVSGARKLQKSRYYPRATSDARVWAQRLIAALPQAVVPGVYGGLRRLDRLARHIRPGRTT